MPRAPNEKAAQAKKLYDAGMKLVEIAGELGVPAGTVRRWKSTYSWDSERSDKSECPKKKAGVRNATPPEVASVMGNPALTDQQRLFCLYYAKSFNATRSYQKAYGCGYLTAKAHGFELLSNVAVREEILRLKRLRYGKALLEPEDIFQKYMDIAFADLTDYVSFAGQAVCLTASDQVDGTILSEVSQGKDGARIKLADRMKALQWLGEHMDLATAEQRARIENLQAGTAKLRGEDPDAEQEDDGFLEALGIKAEEVWQG